MKIVVVMPMAEQRGGSELALWHLVRYGQGLGVEWVVVFLEQGPMAAQFREASCRVHVVEAGRLRQPVRLARAVRRLAAITRRENADLVLGWLAKGQVYAGLAARWAGRPAVWFQHGLPADLHWMDRLATLLPARGVLACSAAGAQMQHRALWPHRPTRVVHPAVEVRRFAPDALPAPRAMRGKLGLPTEGPLVGMVGRLQRWKGMHTFVAAMPRVLRAHPDAHGLIVGGKHDLEPNYQEEVTRQIQRLGLEGRIIQAGFQTNVPEWMQALDVFVHASDREPFGMVIIEAMALGKPVVAGAAAGPTEIITEGQDGLLAPFEDSEALAQQILRFLDEPDFARAAGQAAQARAHDFTPEKFAGRLVEAVRELAFCAPHAHGKAEAVSTFGRFFL